MKKVLFVAIIATLIAVGCEKTEIINPNLGTEILFSPELGKLTKAEGDGDPTTLQTQGFKVTAIMAYDDPYTTGDDKNEFGQIYDNISNTPFGYTEGTGWAPTGNVKQYWWPGTGKELVFVAISSKGNAKFLPGIYTDQNQSGLHIVETTSDVDGKDVKGITMSPYNIEGFEVTPAATTPAEGETPASHTIPNDDLMIADAVKQDQSDNNKVVDLMFRHTLSKVEFIFVTNPQSNNGGGTGEEEPEQPAEETIEVEVNSIKVAGIVSKGDLTVTPIWEEGALLSSYYNGVDGETDTFVWEPSAVATDKKEYSITKNLVLTTEKKDYATWLVIPQTIKDSNTTELKVEIAYTINDREFTSIFPLYTETLTKWGVNQYIKYTINLSPNLITFNPSVEDWSNPTDVEHNN